MERISFQQMLLGQLDIHIQRNKFGPATTHIIYKLTQNGKNT